MRRIKRNKWSSPTNHLQTKRGKVPAIGRLRCLIFLDWQGLSFGLCGNSKIYRTCWMVMEDGMGGDEDGDGMDVWNASLSCLVLRLLTFTTKRV